MNLREATIKDHWRHVFSKEYPTRFNAISFENLYCLADSEISFSAGISAIVGGNGVGKSTLVASIGQLLAPNPNSVEDGYAERLKGSTIRGRVFTDGAVLEIAVQDDPLGSRVRAGDEFRGEYRTLDPSALAIRCLNQIRLDHNFDDLLEPTTPLELDQEELQIASYLVGKEYTSIQIYEISDYGGFETFPYFRVSSAGVEYGSDGMGRGELSLMLSYWTLRDAPPSSILILEEPETHVSPRSQDCLMNIVAKLSDERAIWVIVTTHSPTVIRHIPRQHLKLLARSQGPASCMTNATKLDVGLILGGGVAYNGIILVEDDAAKRFVMVLFEVLVPEMLRQFEIITVGTESNITTILRVMPSTGSWLTVFGAYDGDMKTKQVDGKYNWKYSFLPGDGSPEQVLIAMTEKADFAPLLAAELGQSGERVTMAFQHVAGVDPHEYFGRFSTFLTLDLATIQRAFVRIWLRDKENEKAAKSFIEEVLKAAGDG